MKVMQNIFLKTDRRNLSLFFYSSKRISWIDLAKGIAIILVIVGHSVWFGTAVRNFIFSFHMPLFFMLSGYTLRVADNKDDFFCNLVKNFKHLLVPCLFVGFMSILVSWCKNTNFNINELLNYIYSGCVALFWASGVGAYTYPGIGPIWFIISLFWAKTIIDLVSIFFPGNSGRFVFYFLGFSGLALGMNKILLPQNLDVTLVAVFYVYLGMLWKKYQDVLNVYADLLFWLSVIIWFLCLYNGIYIEMATRSYPFYVLSLIEATCASFAVCCLCKGLVLNFYVKSFFVFVGVRSLLIFYVHHLDWLLNWFSSVILNSQSYWGICFSRVFVELLISFVILLLYKFVLNKLVNLLLTRIFNLQYHK